MCQGRTGEKYKGGGGLHKTKSGSVKSDCTRGMIQNTSPPLPLKIISTRLVSFFKCRISGQCLSVLAKMSLVFFRGEFVSTFKDRLLSFASVSKTQREKYVILILI